MDEKEDAKRCGYYVKRKKRHCRMLPAKGNTYCAEHLCFQENQQGVEQKRVKCPLDPSHTVFEERLENHLKKCNSRKKKQQIFYEENTNSGILNYEYTDIEKLPLSSVPKDDIYDLIKRIKECYSKLKLNIEKCIGTHRVLKEELANQEYGPTTRKHFIQQASLINIMETSNAFHGNIAFIEFGAGKGKLSHWLQKAVGPIENIKYLLVDRQNSRNKFDCFHKREDQGPTFTRLSIDIEHLNLGKVDDVAGKNIVALGKHLCGGATDLSLRCLMEPKQPEAQNASKKQKLDSAESHVELIVFALCCFHRCSWPSYVGREFFTENGFSAVDFHRMTHMCSWSTCGFRYHEKGHTQPLVDSAEDIVTVIQEDLQLDADEKKNIGLQCKRLIDFGRMKYLKAHGYESELLYYVEPNVTLEDVVLLAKRR